MASIQIHQDLYNFERKRKGFTSRQLAGLGVAAAIAVGMGALLVYALRIPWVIGIDLAILAATPAVVAGFMPIAGMPLERFAEKIDEYGQRGNALCLNLEELEPMSGQRDKSYAKKIKQKGVERGI